MSKRKSWELSRRAFLGGAACSIALPYLEAMVPSVQRAKAAGDNPVRLMYVYVPNGIIRTQFTPQNTGAGYTLTPQLSGLADVRDEFSILSGLSNKPGGGSYTYPDGTTSSDGPGDHARDTGTFLTAARLFKTDGSDIRNGISVDQVAANYTQAFTAIPSLVLATREGSYGGDSGYAPIYKANISWRDETTPADKETSPLAVFNRLFAGFDVGETEAERTARIARENSILDNVTGDIASLRTRLGTADDQKLDQYLTGIRQLEISLAASEGMPICDPGAAPGDPANFPELVDQMWQVVALAFQCDRTRVASMLMEKGGTYDFLVVDGSPIGSNHHQMSHLENVGPDVRRIEAINKWQIDSFGNLLRILRGMEQGDGSNLLDSTLVMFGGGLDATGASNRDPLGDLTPQQSGPVHRHTNLPLLLGGRGCGAHTPGRHIVYNDEEPIADLYVSMLQAAGVDTNTFGIEGTGPLAQLT